MEKSKLLALLVAGGALAVAGCVKDDSNRKSLEGFLKEAPCSSSLTEGQSKIQDHYSGLMKLFEDYNKKLIDDSEKPFNYFDRLESLERIENTSDSLFALGLNDRYRVKWDGKDCSAQDVVYANLCLAYYNLSKVVDKITGSRAESYKEECLEKCQEYAGIVKGNDSKLYDELNSKLKGYLE
tara:strand:- start:200 stop:745 length:546 start_codon:yes stop_codon:yes gene_type:complete